MGAGPGEGERPGGPSPAVLKEADVGSLTASGKQPWGWRRRARSPRLPSESSTKPAARSSGSGLSRGGWLRSAPGAQGWLLGPWGGVCSGPPPALTGGWHPQASVACERITLMRLRVSVSRSPSVRTLVVGYRAQPSDLSVTQQSAKTLSLAMPPSQVRS